MQKIELKNKAVSFLTYTANRLQYINTDLYNDLIKATEFYSQPFQPSLITELFEGFFNNREPKPEGIYFLKQNNVTVMRFEVTDCNRVGISFEGYSPGYRPRVFTLDQFITDCNRAGIELTFSPLAIEKLNLK